MAFLDETGLAELWSLVKAEDAEVLASPGKTEILQYTGTGTVGASKPMSFTFRFAPKVLLFRRSSVDAPSIDTTDSSFMSINCLICENFNAETFAATSTTNLYARTRNGGKTVEFYYNTSAASMAYAQNNYSGHFYTIIALG